MLVGIVYYLRCLRLQDNVSKTFLIERRRFEKTQIFTQNNIKINNLRFLLECTDDTTTSTTSKTKVHFMFSFLRLLTRFLQGKFLLFAKMCFFSNHSVFTYLFGNTTANSSQNLLVQQEFNSTLIYITFAWTTLIQLSSPLQGTSLYRVSDPTKAHDMQTCLWRFKESTWT